MFPSSRRKRCKSHGNAKNAADLPYPAYHPEYPFAAPPRCTPPVRKTSPRSPTREPCWKIRHFPAAPCPPSAGKKRHVPSPGAFPEFHRASSPSGCGTLKSRRRKRPAPHIPSPKEASFRLHTTNKRLHTGISVNIQITKTSLNGTSLHYYLCFSHPPKFIPHRVISTESVPSGHGTTSL